MLTNYLKQFVRDVMSQKLRTAMTVFGIVWGTVAVTLLLAFGEGLGHQLRVSWLGLGENIIICWPAQTSRAWEGLPKGRRIRLTDEDIDMVRREVPEIQAISSEYRNSDHALKVGRKVLVPQVVGTSPVFALMRNIIPAAGGRFIDPLDMRDRRRVLFLGDQLAQDLFGDGEPVGTYVYMAGVPFLVVGVMQTKYQDSSYSGSDDDKAWIPGESYKTLFGDKYVDNFVFQVDDARQVEAATDKMLAVLARRHQFDPEDREALIMWDTTEMMSFFEDFILLFQSFLAVLGTLTLVVGGIGVSNIMNVVVEERTPEIGLKMALGAKRRYVMGQFLLETFMITLIGGAVGFALGWSVCLAFPSLGLEQYVGNPTISAKIALGTVVVLGVISLIAGWFPARSAANLNPVEALKM